MRCALRIARQPHPDLGDDRQRSFAADDRADQIQPDGILGRSAELHDAPVGQHRFDAQHVIHRDAVFQRVRPAGIRRHIAADRAGALARRIGSVVIAGALQSVGQPDVDHARLDDGIAVAKVDFQNPLHPREHDHHAAADRQAAAGQARSGSARQKRHASCIANLHDLGDIVRVVRGKTTTSGLFFSIVKPSHS